MHRFFVHVRDMVIKYGERLPAVALLFGLVWDSFTLNRPDNLFENVVVLGYLILAACLILLLNMNRARAQEGKQLLLLLILQFAFGNLTSGLLVLYVKSGTLLGSIIFLGVLGVLLLSNEFLRKRYALATINIAVWFLLLLSYSTIAVPVALGMFGDAVFLLSVIVALFVVACFLLIIRSVARAAIVAHMRSIAVTVAIIAAVFSGLYFTGGIPPVPLAARHIGVYHSVEKIGNSYAVTYEKPAWYAFWSDTAGTYAHVAYGDPVYCFTAVFAPSRIDTNIYHHWEYKDEEGDWQTTALIPFDISGGRAEGYRGYTYTTRVTPGIWRCSIETERGAIVGRVTFTVIEGTPVLTNTEL